MTDPCQEDYKRFEKWGIEATRQKRDAGLLDPHRVGRCADAWLAAKDREASAISEKRAAVHSTIDRVQRRDALEVARKSYRFSRWPVVVALLSIVVTLALARGC